MKKILSMTLLLLLVSCNTTVQDKDTLSQKTVMQTYTQENRGINLSSMELDGFISLNGLNGDEEIANIDISNNSVQVLNISEYPDLLRLIADNNNVKYFNDIKYPEGIKHISLSGNRLETLQGIDALTELKTLDLSNNKLDEDDFRELASLENLELVYAEGNNVSEEFLSNLESFNAVYLGKIK